MTATVTTEQRHVASCEQLLHATAEEPEARVVLKHLDTLWFNTGTLCNITCRNCYIESTPRNDRLSYITLEEIRPYLDEIERDRLGAQEIAFTGGEPFMNPQICEMIEECLKRGFRTMVLTNAMRPIHRHKKRLVELLQTYGEKLTIRVSLDHYTAERHDCERGANSFAKTLDGLIWFASQGFKLAVGGRTIWGEDIASERAGFAYTAGPQEVARHTNVPPIMLAFPTDGECFLALKQDKVDAFTQDSPIIAAVAGHEGVEYEPVGPIYSPGLYGIGVPPDDSKWRDTISFTLQDLIKDGTYEKIYQKWFGQKGKFPMPINARPQLPSDVFGDQNAFVWPD